MMQKLKLLLCFSIILHNGELTDRVVKVTTPLSDIFQQSSFFSVDVM